VNWRRVHPTCAAAGPKPRRGQAIHAPPLAGRAAGRAWPLLHRLGTWAERTNRVSGPMLAFVLILVLLGAWYIHLHLALLVVSNGAGLWALLVIYRIFATLNGEAAARWALTLFGVYPFAFFQAAGYPESLMIFFSALTILLALPGNHLWAGVALGLGVWLAKRPTWRGPTIGMLTLFQGLFFYLFVRQFPII